MPRKSSVLLHLLCPLLLLLAWPVLQAQDERPPNILLILADDVGREVIGAYGGESYQTPEIDALAARGLRFDHFYSATVCHPSRITLLTGRYPWNVGGDRWGSFPNEAEEQNLAHELKQAGYATAIAGKWQLALLKKDPEHPQRVGFDESCLFGWHEGPRYWSPLIWQNGAIREGLEDAFGPEVYTSFLIDFMERNREKPFFAFYSMALCHAVSDDLNPHPPHGPEGRYMTYAEMVAEMDLRVGEIVKAVEELGLSENTLIFFTSDNGTTGTNFIRHEGRELIREKGISSMWKGREIQPGKGKLTDWGTRVPTMAVWPGKIESGKTTETLADLSDLLPTFTELAGVTETDYFLDGRSFAGLLTGGKHAHPRKWVCTPHKGEEMAIRSEDWKLLSNGKLFDMKQDPQEENPILPENDTSESAAARQKLEAWRSEVVPTQ